MDRGPLIQADVVLFNLGRQSGHIGLPSRYDVPSLSTASLSSHQINRERTDLGSPRQSPMNVRRRSVAFGDSRPSGANP